MTACSAELLPWHCKLTIVVCVHCHQEVEKPLALKGQRTRQRGLRGSSDMAVGGQGDKTGQQAGADAEMLPSKASDDLYTRCWSARTSSVQASSSTKDVACQRPPASQLPAPHALHRSVGCAPELGSNGHKPSMALDNASRNMGALLLRGWAMLAEHCPECNVRMLVHLACAFACCISAICST